MADSHTPSEAKRAKPDKEEEGEPPAMSTTAVPSAASVPAPAPSMSSAHEAILKAFWESIPEAVRNGPEEIATAYLRKLMASFQESQARGDRPVTKTFKAIHDYRKFIVDNYVPLHPELRKLSEGHFDAEFLRGFKAGRPVLTEVHPYVFTIRIFSMEWCEKVLAEMDNFEAWAAATGLNINRPNSMNNYGAILDDMGMDAVFQDFTINYVRPLASVLFPNSGADTLDSHHAFVVDYTMGKDVGLGFHVDDSEITLNLCLGRVFTEGQLYFRGRRCRMHQQTPHRPHEIFNYNHVPGMCVLHLGRHRHGARNITSGHRSNLILWCRSSVFRSTFNDRACTSWCGLYDETAVSDGGSGTHVPVPGAVRASAIPRVPAGGSASGAPSVSL